MSTAWSPIRSKHRETMIIRRPHSWSFGSRPNESTCWTKRRFARSISSSRSTSVSACSRFRDGERVERDADHLLGARAHLLERVDEHPVGRDGRRELHELRDRHAVVADPLEVQVDVEHREDEPQVGRDRRLPREQLLDALLDREVARVDLVVERDHLVGELLVLLHERVERAAQRAQHERALLVHRRLELVEIFLEADPHPNLPVT